MGPHSCPLWKVRMLSYFFGQQCRCIRSDFASLRFRMTTVLLGVHSITKTKSCLTLKVTQSIPYPAYNKAKKVNDMMLLKVRWRSLSKKTSSSAAWQCFYFFFWSLFQLEAAAEQTKTVKYLHLGSLGREPKAGSSCVVAGWGQTSKKKQSDVLMSANVTVVDRKKCSKYYGSKPVITKEMICAGSEKVDTCQVGCVQQGSDLS